MAHLHKVVFIAAIFFISAWATESASASDLPSDLCSLLPATQVSSILGTAYDSPQKSVAPRFSAGTPEGTDCTYQPKDAAASKLLFRSHVDPKAEDTKWLFYRLGEFTKTKTPVSGLGDEAYFDASHGLHVRKGNVRMFFNLVPTGTFNAEKEKQMKDLAAGVVSQL